MNAAGSRRCRSAAVTRDSDNESPATSRQRIRRPRRARDRTAHRQGHPEGEAGVAAIPERAFRPGARAASFRPWHSAAVQSLPIACVRRQGQVRTHRQATAGGTSPPSRLPPNSPSFWLTPSRNPLRAMRRRINLPRRVSVRLGLSGHRWRLVLTEHRRLCAYLLLHSTTESRQGSDHKYLESAAPSTSTIGAPSMNDRHRSATTGFLVRERTVRTLDPVAMSSRHPTPSRQLPKWHAGQDGAHRDRPG